MSPRRLRLSVYHTVILLLASTAYFGIRVLEIYWTEYGRTDADHMWAAAVAARHGTLRYIQDVGKIDDPRTWAESKLFKRDPEVFTALVRPPGYLVLYDYPPVLAVFLIPFGLLGIHSFAAFWWILSVALYLLTIWRVITDLRIRFLFSAFALHFPPFLKHLEFGSTLIVVMGLALCCGSFGVALAGWTKLYPWALLLARGAKTQRIVIWVIALGVLGLIAAGFDIKPFYSWWSNLSQHQRAAGHAGMLTSARMAVAGILLVLALHKKWHPAIVFAIAQALSPVWWPGYWCVFVPVLGVFVNRILKEAKMNTVHLEH